MPPERRSLDIAPARLWQGRTRHSLLAMSRVSGERFAMIYPRITSDPRMTRAGLHTYIALASFANNNRVAWPSEPALAQACGLSERSVRRGVANLLEMGVIKVGRRYNKSNVYTLTEQPNEAKADQNAESDEDSSDQLAGANEDSSDQLAGASEATCWPTEQTTLVEQTTVKIGQTTTPASQAAAASALLDFDSISTKERPVSIEDPDDPVNEEVTFIMDEVRERTGWLDTAQVRDMTAAAKKALAEGAPVGKVINGLKGWHADITAQVIHSPALIGSRIARATDHFTPRVQAHIEAAERKSCLDYETKRAMALAGTGPALFDVD